MHYPMRISTHTPAWGVTGRCHFMWRVCTNFNSHARVGRDCMQKLLQAFSGNFNSHARVGRDRYRAKHTCFVKGFQLTRPRGA